jgi:hypothetical protein
VTSEKRANRRIRLLLAAFLVVFAAAFARAGWLQVVHASTYGKQAQRMHEETTTTQAGRGSILDRTGVQLAIGEQDTTIYADPTMVADPRGVAVAAQHILGADANTLYPQLVQKKSHFVYVARFVDSKLADRFLAKKFVGVNSYPEELRAYPQNTVAAQVLGFAGTDNKGLGGLEFEYDKKLSGTPGKQTIIRDATGQAIDVISATPERQGHDVYTTLDSRIQANAEAVLRRTVVAARARSATAIVLDPRTGPGTGLQREHDTEGPAVLPAQSCGDRHVRARLDLQARDDRRRAVGRHRHPRHEVPAAVLDPRRRPRHPRRRVPPHRVPDRLADPLALVERRRRDDRREARRAGTDGLDQQVRLRREDGHRLPG